MSDTHPLPARMGDAWIGPTVSLLSFILIAAGERGLMPLTVGRWLSVLVMAVAVAWTARGSGAIARLAEIYLWLAFILAIYHLHWLADWVSGATGVASINILRAVMIANLAAVIWAVWLLARASRQRRAQDSSEFLLEWAGALFVVGAVVFWIGARTFPGMALESVHANPIAHRWTSVSFAIAAVITLAALVLFTRALGAKGDGALATMGLTVFALATTFWLLHLTFRLTVVVHAANEWHKAAAAPSWYEPWRVWGASLFALYSILAYVGLALYGGALLASSRLPRWAAWMCMGAGIVAAPLGGLPLFIHVPLWLIGLVLLK
jgi:hypothetical protein